MASHLKLVEPASPFEGEAVDFIILGLWGAEQNTADIAHMLCLPESAIVERLPALLRGRAAFRQAVGALQ